MRVTTTLNKNTVKGPTVTARSGNRRVTVPVFPGEPEGRAHGEAARTLVANIVPGYRRVEVQNSVKCIFTQPGKTVFTYKDV